MEELEVAWLIVHATRIQSIVHFLALRRRLYARECENPVRQAISLNLDTGCRGIQLFNLIRGKCNRTGADVLHAPGTAYSGPSWTAPSAEPCPGTSGPLPRPRHPRTGPAGMLVQKIDAVGPKAAGDCRHRDGSSDAQEGAAIEAALCAVVMKIPHNYEPFVEHLHRLL